MEELNRLCNDGEFMPVKLPCPPPYSGPYYYYPSGNIPFPPPAEGSFNNYESSGGEGGAPISAGAVAGIIILMGLLIVMLCLFAIKFRTRMFGRRSILRFSGTRNARNRDVEAAGDLATTNSGDIQFLSVVGGGLEEKLVNLLPVYEYVRFQDEGKELLNVEQKGEEGNSCTECAVCLSLFEEKDIVRILPKCKHVFHLLCIDKWFESHANCPLCRERITLQTIQLFLETSEDHTDNIDRDHPQLAEFNACQNEANHQLSNRSHDVDDHPANCFHLQLAVDNCEDQHCHPMLIHHNQNHSSSEQETEAVATCTPRDNQINGVLQESAAANDDNPQIGYHIHTKQYQSNPAVDQKHGLCERLNTSALQKPYDDDQGFSVSVADHAVLEGQSSYHDHEMRSHSQNQSWCGKENETPLLQK